MLFTPIQLGNLVLENRTIMAPMQRWQGTPEGYATDYHVKHYSSRAESDLGLIIIESTAIAENGRLFQNDIGIFTDDHIEPIKKVIEEVHKYEKPIFIQLCHGGRKSSPENKGKFMAPSPLAFDEKYGTPSEMTQEDINNVKNDFVEAAKRAIKAGVDGIELHAAHGYLLHQFLSPLSNVRNDAYGGSVENRGKLLRDILIAIREEVGKEFPILIRVSAKDYDEGGLNPETIGGILKGLEPYHDGVHVSSGGLTPSPPPSVYPGYQVAFAEEIKKIVTVPVIAVGKIHTKNLAEDVLKAKKADCIAIGEPLLDDPNFVGKWKMNE